MDYPTMTAAQIDDWMATWMRLNGPYGTFYFGDPSKATPRGVATGTPVVDSPGASLATSASTTSGDILTFTATTGVRIGQLVAGTNIAGGSTVTAFDATTVTLSYVVTGTVASGATITFSGMSGNDLYTKGWTHSVTGIMNAGETTTVTC